MSDKHDVTLADTIYHLTNGVGEKPYWRRTGAENERVTVFVADDCELCEIAFIDNDGDEELAKAICAAGKHLTDLQAANAELTKKLAEAEKRVAELEARIAEKRVAEAEVRIKELNAEVWDLKLTPLPKSDPTTAVVSEPVNFQAANAELKIERGESVPGKVGKV